MTDPSSKEQPMDIPLWPGADRIVTLALYFSEHLDEYTPDALRQAATQSGFSPDEIEAAYAQAVERNRKDAQTRPLRTRARWIVLAAYGLVYAVLAVAFLTGNQAYGAGVIALGVLTVVLAIALGISFLWLRRRRASSDSMQGALMTLLAVPLVLLVAVTGLCVVTARPFGT